MPGQNVRGSCGDGFMLKHCERLCLKHFVKRNIEWEILHLCPSWFRFVDLENCKQKLS